MAQDERSALIFALPLEPPLRGTHTCERKQNFRRAKSEWHSKLLPGQWALVLQKFLLVRFHICAWLCRANGPSTKFTVGRDDSARRSGGTKYVWEGRMKGQV